MSSGEFADATVVFDLDGTLVDTAPDIVRALNQTLDIEGLPHASLPVVRNLIGHGARVLIERAAGFSGVTFSADRLNQLTKSFVEFYRADIAHASLPFPGVTDALDALDASGAKLSVCTNKRTDLSVQLLEALGLAQRFSSIVGADAVEHKKPHPDHYRAAVMRAGGIVRRSMMVGDGPADIGAARAAGSPVALARFGYCDTDLESLGADVLFDDYSELMAVCRRLLPARP